MLGDYALEKMIRAQTLARDWTANSDVPVEHRLGEGNPAEVILDHAQAVRPDLIVMGYEHPTGLARYFKKSVTDVVLRSAPCPVLVVGPTGKLRNSKSGDQPADSTATQVSSWEPAEQLSRLC
jgi:nucleotide-binding universal stress UspA family protein